MPPTLTLRKVSGRIDEEATVDPCDNAKSNNHLNRRLPTDQNHWTRYFIMSWFMVLLVLWFSLSKLAWLKTVVLSPAVMCFWLVVEPNQHNDISQRIIPLAIVLSTVAAHLPLAIAAAITGICILLFGLFTVPATNIRPESAVPVVSAVLLMISVLLVDNFFVWVVSATFDKGQSPLTAPDPLQDNGQRVLRYLLSDLQKHEVISIRRLSNAQWTLVAALGASLVTVDIFKPKGRTLYNISRRAVLTLAAARFIRIVSFCLTVLPSQTKRCFVERFPQPPNDWSEWILVGMRPYSHGGCNDLIISGHAVVLTVLACVSASVGPGLIFRISVWALVAIDYMAEIYEGFHYSVDMWLGAILVYLMWKIMQRVEHMSNRPTTSIERNVLSKLGTCTVLMYTLPVLVAYVQLTVLPRAMANVVIVVYASTALGFLVKSVQCQVDHRAAYQHMAQHTLLSLLYLALGIYL